MRGRLKTSAEDSEKLLPRCLKRGCVISRGIRRHPAHSRGEPNTKFWIHESKKLWIITEYDRIYSPEPMWKSDKCPDPEKRVCPTTNSVPLTSCYFSHHSNKVCAKRRRLLSWDSYHISKGPRRKLLGSSLGNEGRARKPKPYTLYMIEHFLSMVESRRCLWAGCQGPKQSCITQ